MNDGFLISLLTSGLLYGTPLLIAGLGELLAERSGVLNLGVEGMMLVGAVTAFWVAEKAGGPTAIGILAGVAAGAAAGAAMALIHAFMAITLRVSQIVSGLALTIFGGSLGLSTFLGEIGDLTKEPGRRSLQPLNVFGLDHLPGIGPVLFHQNLFTYGSWVLAAGVAFYLSRTRVGLNVRAVGDDPAAADAMGINVARYRYAHTVVGGAFAGVGGACFTLAISPAWSAGLTAGAGWIAVALVIFAFWRPSLLVLGAYLFGIVTSLGFDLQAHGVHLPPELFSGLPYVMTIVVLVAMSTVLSKRRVGAPSGLGEAYSREDA